MPLLHVDDRPQDVHYAFEGRRPAIGSMASAATHGVASLLLVLAIQAAREAPVPAARANFHSQRLIWLPNDLGGGGRAGGGNQSTSPARKQQSPGDHSVATAPPQPSMTLAEPPLEVLPVAVVPIGNAVEFFRGAIAGDSSTEALGPRDGSGGNGAGRTFGTGNAQNTGIGDGVRAGGPGVTTPVPVVQIKPQYTAEAMRAKVQGTVRLECVVLTDGTVGDVKITHSLDAAFGLDQEAITAARQWRFKPGLLNGKPVPVIVTIDLTFTLR